MSPLGTGTERELRAIIDSAPSPTAFIDRKEHERLLAREKGAREAAELANQRLESLAASLTRLQAISSRLSGALTSSQVASVVVEEGVAALEGQSGVLLVPSADGEALEVAGSYGAPDRFLEGLLRVGMDAPFPLAKAYRSRELEVLETRAEVKACYPDLAVGPTALPGPGALVCIPLSIEGSVLGALGVTFSSERRFSEEQRAFAITLARQCAHALDRARLFEAEIRSNQALRLLAQAGDVLSSSLDCEATLHNVALLMMPSLGDFCFFDMVEGSVVRRSARAYQNPATEALLGKTEWTRSANEELNLCALSSGRSGFHPEVDDRWMQRAAEGPEHLEVLRALGICSMITVPVVARRETLGALTLCFAASGRHHTAIDLVLAEELARRTAIAVENARLHRASQEATRRAQEANRLSEQANRAKDEFLGVVSHELRTPLNAILGWSQLLCGDRLKDPAIVQKGVAVIERNARAQVKLIEDILDVSRIISGKLRLEPRPLDLEPVLRASVEVVRPAADAKGVELLVLAEPGAIVSGDPDRLQQVAWNLLSNAVKFTAKGGVVEVRLERRERSARIVIHDSGKGIDPAFLPYVFDRFRQADSSTTRRHGGLGLGLAIVRHVVELHGGSVRVESDGLEQGATFTVKLPLRAESHAGRDPLQRAVLDSDPGMIIVRLDGLRVLVVDDEFDAREMIATLLSVSGADVTVVSSAAEAFARLEAFGADVLVSDVGMPGDDGYALIRKIRASRASYARIPALALTAYAAPDDARRAVLAGFHAHLPKPAEPAVLTALVASLGGRSASPVSTS